MEHLTRRALVSGAAAAVSTVAFAAPSGADPIFAAIRRHRDAWTAFGALVSRLNKLETSLPENRRRTDFDYHDGFKFTLVETDAPEWIEAQRSYDPTIKAVDQAADDLLDVEPTTVEGVCAFLRYAYEYERDGNEWGLQYVAPDDPLRHVDWLAYACHKAADTLENIRAAGGAS